MPMSHSAQPQFPAQSKPLDPEEVRTRYADELAKEQAYVSDLFERIDAEVATANAKLAEVQLRVDRCVPDAEELVRRETEYHALNAKLDRLTIAQMGLVFGRVDCEPSSGTPENPSPDDPALERRYVGRMGIDDPEDNYRTLLLDWRAPMARPFYLATTANPEGVHVRRHIRTSNRTVTAISDERLGGAKQGTHAAAGDNPAGDVDFATERGGVASESALLAAVNQVRDGRMASIVQTIQREQDEIIRDPSRGVVVVEGGPGTGKTAVALHRVAYLLYTWREQLEKSGVLIVGPNSTFVDYISQVLPELGETGVVLRTVGTMYPGLVPVAEEPMLGREIKGSLEMVHILKKAVAAYQSLPEEPVEVMAEGLTLTIDAALVKRARTRARRSHFPHNRARGIFLDAAVDLLARQLAEKIGADPLGGKNLLSEADIAELHDELAQEPAVMDAVDQFWPELEPTKVLANLLSSTQRIANAAGEYDEETQGALFRTDGFAFTAADAALADELAVLIGVEDPEQARKAADKVWKQQVEEAQEALDILTGSASQDLDDGFDAEILMAHDVIDAETLAQRQRVRDNRTTAQRASEDLQWAYGHVVVDEAQELSPMEWRMLMRRSPNRWMTVVGDTAQTGSPAGVDAWADALEPYVKNRFSLHQLSVNYRTPAAIMDEANALLPLIAPDQVPAEAIRPGDWPVLHAGSAEELSTRLSQLRSADPRRSIVAIHADEVSAATVAAQWHLPDWVQVLSMSAVKGLEFDHMVVLNPQELIDSSPQGLNDLYVAMTRATQSLTLAGGFDLV